MKLDDLDNYEVEELINRYVRGERTRAIFKRRLIDEIVIEKLAEEFDLSTSQTKRILNKANEQFFKHFDMEGKIK